MGTLPIILCPWLARCTGAETLQCHPNPRFIAFSACGSIVNRRQHPITFVPQYVAAVPSWAVTFLPVVGIRHYRTEKAMDIPHIFRRIQAGDRKAFAEVVGKYQRALFGFLGRMGLSPSQAEDVAQETFLRAWRHLGQYKPDRGEFSTWLFTIARNLALNEANRTASSRGLPATDDLPEPACGRLQPQDEFELAQRRRRVHAALCELPVADRCVLALAYLQDMNVAEIARIEGSTTGAIKTRLHRARGRLSRLLENDNA